MGSDVIASLVTAAPAALRRPVKLAFRSIGLATSRLRPLPDFLIIGSHRSGTSSLHKYLQQHPYIASNFPRLQQIKGVRYFDEHFWRGTAWYRSHFPTAAFREYLQRRHGGPALAGEASPYYLFHPAAATRASTILPAVKLVVLLRNPIDRAYSHWRRQRVAGREPLATLEEALAAEPIRLAGEEERILRDARYYSYAHENFSYTTQGLYLASLRKWREHYPPERVFVESSEALFAHPQRVYDRVLEFLGLPPFALRDAAPVEVNPASERLSARTRGELATRFAAPNEQLEAHLGMKFGWDVPATR